MRRILVAIAVSLVWSSLGYAQLPSQLDLVSGLRSAGMVDLAIMRLEELKKQPNLLLKEELAILPLEMARTRLEQASREGEDSKRAALLAQARGEFDGFIKANPTHPMVATANVELARLESLHAKSQLSKGRRLEGDAKALEYSKARPAFDRAIGRYQSAMTLLDNRLKTMDEKDPLAVRLLQSRREAELDSAILTYEKALTFVGDDERRQRGDEITKSQKIFDRMADKPGAPRVSHLAYVWSLRCQNEIGDPAKSIQALVKFEAANRQNREAADAVRLVRFWFINELRDPEAKESPLQRLTNTQAAAERWLRMYPDALTTSEGLGTRFLLARTHEAQAKQPGNIRFDKSNRIIGMTATAKGHLEDANKIYKDLIETENEYTERSQRSRLQNMLAMLDADGKGGDPELKSIRTLEQGYIAAQVQIARLLNAKQAAGEKGGMTPEQLEAEEKRRGKNAVEYLERGLRSITSKDTPREVFDAQMLLIQFLTQYGRSVEAAVLGEALARNNPRAPKAALAAQLAVYAYNTSLGKMKQPGAAGDPDSEAADISRIKALAKFAEATWPTEGPTDACRHVHAFFLSNRDKDYETAWATYSRISSAYADVSQARREMAAAMFFLVKSEERDVRKNRDDQRQKITAKAAQWKTTLDLLEALAEPAPTMRAGEIESYAGAKTMAAQLYYMAGDYDKTKAVVNALAGTLAKKSNLDEARSADMSFTARSLRYNAFQAQAGDLIRDKKFADVVALLDPEIKAITDEIAKGPPATATPGFDRMRRAQRDLLIAAMTSSVQDKKIDRASELLDVLEKSGGSLDANIAVLRQLVSAVRNQIEGLKAEKNEDGAKELATSFTEFLDKVGSNQAKLSNAMLGFLAQGYAGVEKHDKAAELFQQAIDKVAMAPMGDPKVVQQLQYLQAKSYRQAAGKENFDKANNLMKGIVGNPLTDKAPTPPAKRPWGYSSIEIRKEYCMLLEDQKLFNSAVQNWVRLTNEFVRGGLQNLIRTEKIDGLRPDFLARAELFDALMPGWAFRQRLQFIFTTVLPDLVQKRKSSRELYFDLFYEAQRASARAYASLDKKTTKVDVDGKLSDIGQKLFDLVSKNTDVPLELREKITKLVESHAAMKKRYDELMATNPKS